LWVGGAERLYPDGKSKWWFAQEQNSLSMMDIIRGCFSSLDILYSYPLNSLNLYHYMGFQFVSLQQIFPINCTTQSKFSNPITDPIKKVNCMTTLFNPLAKSKTTLHTKLYNKRNYIKKDKHKWPIYFSLQQIFLLTA
jgi:hypothetical protein